MFDIDRDVIYGCQLHSGFDGSVAGRYPLEFVAEFDVDTSASAIGDVDLVLLYAIAAAAAVGGVVVFVVHLFHCLQACHLSSLLQQTPKVQR